MNTTVKKALHYCLFLLVLGIICGGLLAAVNSFTSPIITKQEEDKVQGELKEIFGYESRFPQAELPEGTNKAITNIYYWYDSSNTLKGIVYKTSTAGYQSNLVVITAFDINDDKIIGFKVVSSGESRGDALNFDFGVQGQTAGSSITVNNMSGASVSSGAVKSGVNYANKNYLANKVTLIGGAE